MNKMCEVKAIIVLRMSKETLDCHTFSFLGLMLPSEKVTPISQILVRKLINTINIENTML